MNQRADHKSKVGSYTSLGYRAAQVERESGRPLAQGGSADFHSRYDREQLVKQSQQFDRDNGIYQGCINRSVDNTIGNGFSLQGRTADEAFNTKAEALWRDYWKSPEIRNLMCGWQVERTALRCVFVDGDLGTIKTKGGKIQCIESERIRKGSTTPGTGNRIEQGVEINDTGTPVKFHVANYSPNGGITSKTSPYSPDDFIYVANLQRFTQTRGIPALVSNFPMFHRINDVCDSEAIAWQILARLAIAVETDAAGQIGLNVSQVNPAGPDANKVPDVRVQDFDYGTIFYGSKGSKIGGIERNLPGANFPASITMFLRLLGLPIGLPLELILLDWSKTNYSSARAALEQAFRMFTCWQNLLKERWYSPIYTWQVQRWIDAGLLPRIADPFKHEWIAPSFPWIDQLKEAQAWGERIERGLSTQEQACKSLNQDRAEWLQTRGREIKEAIEAARKLNEEFPGSCVDWRIFAGLKPIASSAPTQAEPQKPDYMPDMPEMPSGDEKPVDETPAEGKPE
jgi:lambda family phage portal protein